MKKKVLSIALVAALACGIMTGCGSKPAESAAPADAAPAAQAPADGEAEAVKTVNEGVLTMATNAYFPPYEFYDGDKIVGIDAEIAAAIAEKLGLELKIEDMEFDSIITAVQAGKADMGLAGMTVTEDRLKSIDFSDSYATGVQVVIVKEGSDIATVDDLAGKKIGVQLATTGDIYACDDFGTDNVEEYNKGSDAVMALLSGKVDAVIIDNESAKSFVAANDGLVILDTEYVTEDYAAAISKDNPGLTAAVNAALADLKADGTLQAIIDKYIPAE